MAEVQVDKLLQIIGQKEVELAITREQLQAISQENQELKAKIELVENKKENVVN